MSSSNGDFHNLPKDILVKLIQEVSSEQEKKYQELEKKCKDLEIRHNCLFEVLSGYEPELQSNDCEHKGCNNWMILDSERIYSSGLDYWEVYDPEEHQEHLVCYCEKCEKTFCFQHSHHFPDEEDDFGHPRVQCENCFKQMNSQE